MFKVKSDPEEKGYRYKARLCVQGFMQQYGIDFTDVRYDSLRVLLAIRAEMDLELLQFDMQTAFLYGALDEDIYTKLP